MDQVFKGVADTPRELRDQLWNAANGFDQIISPILNRAQSVVDALERLDKKGELPEGIKDGELGWQIESLAEVLPGRSGSGPGTVRS